MKGRVKEIRKNYYKLIIETRDAATGRRKRLARYFHGGKRQAEARLQQIIEDLLKSEAPYQKPSTLRLADYLRDWLKSRMKLKPKTLQGYGINIEKHIIPHLGGLRVRELSPVQVQQCYAELLASGLSTSTVNRIHVTLHSALDQAVKWGIVKINPADAVDKPRDRRPQVAVLPTESLSLFIEKAKLSAAADVILLALYTGCRRGELLALRWDKVDLARGYIHIDRGLTRIKGKTYVETPKTSSSRRAIPLLPDARAIVERLSANSMSEYVLCRDDGRPLDPDTVSHQFKRVANAAGLSGLQLKTMRHTFATYLLQAGVHIKVVQELLGHASIATTGNIYSHVAPVMQEQAVAKLQKAIDGELWHQNGTKTLSEGTPKQEKEQEPFVKPLL